MAMNTETYGFAAPLMARISETRSRIAERAEEYRLYRRTLTELRNLNARELADLGLAHADLRAVAKGAAAK
ncbi:MAG: DUF1127 domain-containing protein [Pseudomonadota bacterium]